MLSAAVIPFLGGAFGGFIIGFLYQGEILRSAACTYQSREGRQILATLNAKIAIRLMNLEGNVQCEGTGENSGLEIVGDMNQVLALVI